MDTVVPAGIEAGQAFLVRFPPITEEELNREQVIERKSPSFAERLESILIPHSPDECRDGALKSTEVHTVEGSPVGPGVARVSAESRQESPSDSRGKVDDAEPKSLSLVQSLDDFLTPKPDLPEASKRAGPKLLTVQVPPGLAPGSTLFVEIPGENRTVSATVPPNVKSFHVAYTPRPHSDIRPTQASGTMATRQPYGSQEKLLSVRVPPGTPPGTTLHVSVPDEPGRILAAQVPPGNVTKFHVSYIPRERVNSHSGMLPPAYAYRGSGHPTDAPGSAVPSASVLGTAGTGAYKHLVKSANDINSNWI